MDWENQEESGDHNVSEHKLSFSERDIGKEAESRWVKRGLFPQLRNLQEMQPVDGLSVRMCDNSEKFKDGIRKLGI
jgi:hypothetical protein